MLLLLAAGVGMLDWLVSLDGKEGVEEVAAGSGCEPMLLLLVKE